MPQIAWTDDRIAQMRNLYIDERMSCSQVAAALGGVSRNAVIGKIHRLGISRDRPTAEPKPRAKRIDLRRNRVRSKPPADFTRPEANTTMACVEIESRNLSFAEIGRFDETGPMHCRYPVKIDDGSERYCGNDTVAGPWCGAHQQIVWASRDSRAQRRAA